MKTHTKANGFFKDLCTYSKTGWAWWQHPKPGDVCKVPSCTCVPCKPPKKPHYEDRIEAVLAWELAGIFAEYDDELSQWEELK